MSNLNNLTIKEAHDGLVGKKFSARELVSANLDSIETKNEEIYAYLSVAKEESLKDADRVDQLIDRGEPIGRLAGIPLAVKDVIFVKGQPLTAGSKILKDYVAPYDATVIKKLRSENAIFLGKTNMDEFAMGSSTENSAFGITRNPHSLERIPGGSSGGSAAAVAANMAIAALGSDTGGSVRQPAAMSGVVGLKPTYGSVSRYGLVAMSSSLDQIGPMTKTVEDAAILFRSMAGHDRKDATSNPDVGYGDSLLSPDFKSLNDMTIGIPKEYLSDGLDPNVAASMDEVISWFKSKGFKIKEVSMPHTEHALSVYYIIMPAEASTNLARYDGIRFGTRGEEKDLAELYLKNRGDGFGPEVKRRITLGTFVLSAGYYEAYYSRAQKVRTLVKMDFEKAFKDVDVLLTPTAPTVAFKLGEKTEDPIQMYLSDIFTIPANLAGIPAISIPVRGREGKLPVGFQLMGKHWREADLLSLGMLYES